MCLQFLESFHGIRLIHETEWLSSDNLNLYTDSSGNQTLILGCGAYFEGKMGVLVLATRMGRSNF